MQKKHLSPILGIAAVFIFVGAACSSSKNSNINAVEDLNINTSAEDTNSAVNAALEVLENQNTNSAVNSDDVMEKTNTNSSTKVKTNSDDSTEKNENSDDVMEKNTNNNDNKTSNLNVNDDKDREAKKESVSIDNLAFKDATLTIKKGTTVTWKNNDSVSHTVTSTTGSELASSTLSKNGTYSHTFNTAGTFTYRCSLHPSMTGTVVVE